MSSGRNLGLAEKPKVGELQMDWLRSEDLKGEENVTTPEFIIAACGPIARCRAERRLRGGQ
jgi:hypothetical protein